MLNNVFKKQKSEYFEIKNMNFIKNQINLATLSNFINFFFFQTYPFNNW